MAVPQREQPVAALVGADTRCMQEFPAAVLLAHAAMVGAKEAHPLGVATQLSEQALGVARLGQYAVNAGQSAAGGFVEPFRVR